MSAARPERIAALSDIHGNLPALEAVLAEVRGADVDRIVVGGDVVPGPMPRETLAALLDLSVPTRFIRGNGEADVVAVARGEASDRVPPDVLEGLRWVVDELRPGELRAIGSWPLTLRLEITGLGRVLFCHATPRDDREIFTVRTPEAPLRPVFEGVDVDVVVCGHTHMPFDRTVGGVRVVNPGSVGMPFGSPEACWALLGPDGLHLRRTEYDLEAAARRIRDAGAPPPITVDPRRPRSEEEMLRAFEAVAVGTSPSV